MILGGLLAHLHLGSCRLAFLELELVDMESQVEHRAGHLQRAAEFILPRRWGEQGCCSVIFIMGFHYKTMC